MTTEQIIEGNKIIAEFEQPKHLPPIDYMYAEYNTSWDWLMPVVEKIEESATIKIEHRRNQSPAHWCWIWANHDENPESVGFSNSKIESIWIAVVDYVRFVEQKAFEDAINETEKLLSAGTTPPPNKA